MDYTCKEDQFKCNSGHCIAKKLVCDGQKDCRDVSDEMNCPTRYPGGRFCPPQLFQCNNSVCLRKDFLCDGDDDCGDNSDEESSLCSHYSCDLTRKFRCANGGCYNNCLHKSPFNNSFSLSFYHVTLDKCIPIWQICNGEDNCLDGSDENNHTLCKKWPIHCAPNQYKCLNERCIPLEKVCISYLLQNYLKFSRDWILQGTLVLSFLNGSI